MSESPGQHNRPQLDAADESLYKYLLDHMLDVITIIDAAGLIVFQSKSLHEALGYEPAEMYGQPVVDYIHPDDVAEIETALKNLLSGALEASQVQFRLLHRDGRYRRLDSVARLCIRGSFRGVLVNTRDITAAHAAKEALARQNEVLAKIFSVSKHLLSISIPESGEFLQVNETWCRTLGHSRESAVGKTAVQLGVWGSVENRQQVIDVFTGQGRLQGYEAAIYTRTGQKRLMEIDAQLLIVADQPQILMSCTDITDARQIEEELRHSQKMEAIGQLTGGVAHDFNNLIGVTMGSAELLLDLLANQPDALKHAQQIFTAAERGARLTQQLLAFSRRQVLAPEAVDLVEHLANMESILETSVGEHTVIDVTCPPSLWRCQVDPDQLHNALLNLTLNARDAMPDGGRLHFQLSNYTATDGTRTVYGHRVVGELGAGDYVALVVSDSGFGMDEPTLSRAFEPFFSTKEPGRGTGLGLSMVFGFVEQSGGNMCLSSDRDHGTDIVLLLPRT